MDFVTSPAPGPSSDTPNATVFIVDDDADIRHALSLVVRSAGLMDEAYQSASEFLEHYDPQKTGCLLLDIRMPGMSGIELQEVLNSRSTRPPIIFITGYGEVSLVTQAIRAGAVDVFAKPFKVETLLERIHEAVQLDLANRRNQTRAEAIRHRMSKLTSREREIANLLAKGDSPKQIAHRLSISHKTVDNHRAKILEKTNVDNPVQLAQLLAMLE